MLPCSWVPPGPTLRQPRGTWPALCAPGRGGTGRPAYAVHGGDNWYIADLNGVWCIDSLCTAMIVNVCYSTWWPTVYWCDGPTDYWCDDPLFIGVMTYCLSVWWPTVHWCGARELGRAVGRISVYNMFSELCTLLDHRLCYNYTPTHYIVREFSRDGLLQELPKNPLSPFKNFLPPKSLLATNVTCTVSTCCYDHKAVPLSNLRGSNVKVVNRLGWLVQIQSLHARSRSLKMPCIRLLVIMICTCSTLEIATDSWSPANSLCLANS